MFGAAHLTDEIVAAAVSHGSKADRDRVAEVLSPQVRLMVTARLAAKPDRFDCVEEIAQQVLLAMHDALPRLENPTVTGLKAYVSRIVANKVADYLRRGGHRQRAGERSLESTVASASQAAPLWQFLSASGTSPLSAVARSDEFHRVMAGLGRLKPEYREIITLAFFDQLPTGEIAATLGISRPAASMRLIRAVETLRRDITGSSDIR